MPVTKKDEYKKKATTFLESDDDDGEFKPTRRGDPGYQKAGTMAAPSDKKKNMFGESSDEEESFAPKPKNAPLPPIGGRGTVPKPA